MTNTEPKHSENKELSETGKTTNWFKTQTKAHKEYKAFCDMDEQTLEMYTAYRLPTPPKDQPFQEEYPDPETNPLLKEMRTAAQSVRTTSILAHVKSLLFHLLLILVASLGEAGTWVFIALGAFLVVDQIVTAMLLWGQRIAFAKSYAYVESLARLDPDSDITQTYWNFKRWEKWALARYDFASKEELYRALMSKSFTNLKAGPMAGLTVSNETGEEWPLKPVPAEAP
jgi:hypothetical protein